MGRPNQLPDDVNAPVKLRMERLKWVDGDYDQFGAYWGGGSGDFIFYAYGTAYHAIKNAEPVSVFVRAYKREAAKVLVQNILQNATFYR